VLARAQHGALTDPADVEVAELVVRALADRAAGIAAKRLSVTEDLAPGLGVRGDAALLSRMVENVVDNAVTHNEQGGWLRVGASREAAEVRLVVETGGRVLPQQDVDRLAQPFVRAGTDRTAPADGSGLGLSIVAAIAAAHGGRLSMVARPQGGLLVSIALPSAPVAAAATA
jgi:signal transduction histidine kinase